MLKLLRRFTKREALMSLISIVFVAFQVYLELELPDYMSKITTLVYTPGTASSEIWLAGGKMLACCFGSLASAVIVGYFAAQIAAGFSKKLRHNVFGKVQSFSLGEIQKFSTASLITCAIVIL